MQFKALKDSDKQAALNIVKTCFPEAPSICEEFDERFEAHLAPQEGAYVVEFIGAFINEELAGIGGYAMSSMTDSCWELSWGAIHPKFRGKDIFRKLIEHAIENVLRLAITEQVYVMSHIRDAHFYKKMGFQKAFECHVENKSIFWKRIK